MRLGAAAALALALVAWRGDAFQGMAAPGRAARAVRIETDLPPIRVDFRDVAREAGLADPTVSGGETGKRYIVEATGTGVALFDYDNDGLVDIFLVNATTLDGKGAGAAASSRLYRNLGGLHFEDATARAGLLRTAWGQGVCAADYDNDGRRDLFVTHWGRNVLWRNRGDGTFTDATARAGLAAPAGWSTGCSFLDYDNDGRLDLVVTGYVDFDPKTTPLPGAREFCFWKGLPVMCGPRGLPHGRNYLFHNEGGGVFRDATRASGVGKAAPCYGFTATATDFDLDGWPDIYVACDSSPSLLFHNRRDGTFEEVGVLAGAALNDDGQEQAGMGAAAADYDNDGYPDILKTNFSDDTPNLYRNQRDGTFSDQVYQAGLGVRNQFLGWGAHLLDVDNDGLREALLVNGHVYPDVDKSHVPVKYRQPRLLYWNVGGRFRDVSESAGPGISALHSSRGSAAGDLDNDGSLEVAIVNLGEPPSLLRNTGRRGAWLLVKCEGVRANRDAVGARVALRAGGRTLYAEVQTGSSFLSQNDSRLHFGLGAAERYESIEVRWPGGAHEIFPAGAANRMVTLREGGGKPAAPRSTPAVE